MTRDSRRADRGAAFLMRELREIGMEFLTAPPASVPAGKELVHCDLRPGLLGPHRFVAFLTPATPDSSEEGVVVCDCPWTSQLGEHYRGVMDSADPS